MFERDTSSRLIQPPQTVKRRQLLRAVGFITPDVIHIINTLAAYGTLAALGTPPQSDVALVTKFGIRNIEIVKLLNSRRLQVAVTWADVFER